MARIEQFSRSVQHQASFYKHALRIVQAAELQVVERTAEKMVVSTGPGGSTMSLEGTGLTYTAWGALTGGTIERITLGPPNAVEAVISEIAIAGADIWAAINSHRIHKVMGLLAPIELIGGIGNDYVIASVGNDTLSGSGGSDWLEGSDGDDTIDGGAGADVMNGGRGNDVYYVAGDSVWDHGQKGEIDTAYVASSVPGTFIVRDIETIIMTGTRNVKYVGNTDELTIAGNAGQNYIIGSTLQNTISGGDGDDFLIGREGNDLIDGGSGDDVIGEGEGFAMARFNDTYYGKAGNDTIYAFKGDSAYGGAGDDTYYVTKDARIAEAPDEGQDHVITGNLVVRLGRHIETLTFRDVAGAVRGTGNAEDNRILGHLFGDTISGLGGDDELAGQAGDDRLSGESGNDTIDGALGNDLLNGGAGVDSMNGGVGDDGYFVDSSDDVVSDRGKGSDSVTASADFMLPATVEELTLTGQAVSATGNTLQNLLTGNQRDNLLYGLSGDDLLLGGAGGDLFHGGDGEDIASYTDATAGVHTDLRDPALNLGIAAGDTYVSIEGLLGSDFGDTLGGGNGKDAIAGGKGNDALFGYDGNDLLIGDEGNDTLDGGDGADQLISGEGLDRLTGGDGKDLFAFDDYEDGPDTITDFRSGTDLIALNADKFGFVLPLIPGVNFVVDKPLPQDERSGLIFRTGERSLIVDGPGGRGEVTLAIFSNSVVLKPQDIVFFDL